MVQLALDLPRLHESAWDLLFRESELFLILACKPRILCVEGKRCATELYPQPQTSSFERPSVAFSPLHTEVMPQ